MCIQSIIYLIPYIFALPSVLLDLKISFEKFAYKFKMVLPKHSRAAQSISIGNQDRKGIVGCILMSWTRHFRLASALFIILFVFHSCRYAPSRDDDEIFRDDEAFEPKEKKSIVVARRESFLQSRNKPWPRDFGYIHLGKCGGVSLRATLVGYLGRGTRIGEAIARAKVYHLSKPEVQKFDEWIILIRDPVDRILSWWTYDHAANFYYRNDYNGFLARSKLWLKLFECYPTLDEFVTKGLARKKDTMRSSIPSSSDTFNCATLAQMSIPLRGSSFLTSFQHLRFNFDRYFHTLLKFANNKTFYVVRAEHMLGDIKSINNRFGDVKPHTYSLSGVLFQSHWRTKNYPHKDRTISSQGLENLCRHLCHEIQYYKQILELGINLNEETRKESLEQLYDSCPSQVMSDECQLGMTEAEWERNVGHYTKVSNDEIREIHQIRNTVLAARANVTSQNFPDKLHLSHLRESDDKSLGFLHLGRCGGQSVRSLIVSLTKSKLYSVYMKGTWTSDRMPLYWKHFNWIIFLRDPIDRFLSWWTYNHPSNLAMRSDYEEKKNAAPHLLAEWIKLYECYPTFKEFVTNGLRNDDEKYGDDDETICRWVARRALTPAGVGETPLLHDIGYSYTTYSYDIKAEISKHNLLAVRTEYMTKDLDAIESILSQSESKTFRQKKNRTLLGSSRNWPVKASKKVLDANDMQFLCQQLCKDIQIYKYFLHRAVNIDKASFEVSMKRLEKKCPEEARNDTCSKGT
jgi:Sulfotransferase family